MQCGVLMNLGSPSDLSGVSAAYLLGSSYIGIIPSMPRNFACWSSLGLKSSSSPPPVAIKKDAITGSQRSPIVCGSFFIGISICAIILSKGTWDVFEDEDEDDCNADMLCGLLTCAAAAIAFVIGRSKVADSNITGTAEKHASKN